MGDDQRDPIMPPEDEMHQDKRIVMPDVPVAPDVVIPPDTPSDPVTSPPEPIVSPGGTMAPSASSTGDDSASQLDKAASEAPIFPSDDSTAPDGSDTPFSKPETMPRGYTAPFIPSTGLPTGGNPILPLNESGSASTPVIPPD